MRRSVLWDFILGRPTTFILTATLTVLSLILPPESRAKIVVLVGACVVVQTTASWIRDRSSGHRLGRHHGPILNRLLELLSDLGDLTTHKYDLWRIEVYLPKRRWYRSSAELPPFRRFLQRAMSVALKHMPTPTREFSLKDELFGDAFRTGQPAIWWNEEFAQFPTQGSSEVNRWHELRPKVNQELDAKFGAISLNPIVDRVGGQCLGLLVVHTARDPIETTMALGALTRERGKRQLERACHDIHDRLRDG